MLKKLKLLAPVLLFSLLFLFLALLNAAGLAPLPLWTRTLIGVLWIGSLFQYVISFDMQKQIGGWFSVILAALILWAMLCPYPVLFRTPHVISESADIGFRRAWETVHTGVIFENFSPKEWIRDHIAAIGHIDPFRLGRVLAFALLSLVLAACFLYPVAIHHGRIYAKRLGALFFWLAVFAIQTELAQVLSPTRKVTAGGITNSLLGVGFGLGLAIGLQGLQGVYFTFHPRRSRRFNVLGVPIDTLSLSECVTVFDAVLQTPKASKAPTMIAPMGVAGIMQARRDPRMRHILNHTRVNTPDGMPLVWLGRLHGFRDIARVYGPDLMTAVCAAGVAKGWTHYFYGAAPGVAATVKTALEASLPGIRIVGVESPPYRPLSTAEEADLVLRIRRLKPDCFWIGISTPKQLYVMDRFARDVPLACTVLCPVGYAFDVLAGVQDDAPEWIKLAGFQWLHRLFKQPHLWRRYLPDNPRFLFETVLQLFRLRRYPLPFPSGSASTHRTADPHSKRGESSSRRVRVRPERSRPTKNRR